MIVDILIALVIWDLVKFLFSVAVNVVVKMRKPTEYKQAVNKQTAQSKEWNEYLDRLVN